MNKGIVTIVALVLILAMIPLSSACAKPPPPEAKIVIGCSNDLTKVASSIQKWIHEGEQDYVKFLNEKGGIESVPVTALWADEQYSPAVSMDNYKRFKEQGMVVFLPAISPIAVSLKPQLEADKIVLMFFGSNDLAVDPPGWSWSVPPPYGHMTAGLAEWILKNRWHKPTPPKIAYFGWDNDYGHAPMRAVPYLREKYGIEQAGKFQPIPFGTLDTTAQLLVADKAGADFILAQIAPEIIPLLKDLHKLGLQDKITVIGCWAPFATDPMYIEQAGKAAEGVLGTYPFAIPSVGKLGEVKGIKECVEWQQRTKGKVSDQAFYYAGWATAHASCMAIKAAVKEKGWPVTGAAVQEALQKLDVDGGGIIGRMTGTPTKRWLSNTAMITEVRGGKTTPVEDWFEMPNLIEFKAKHPELYK